MKKYFFQVSVSKLVNTLIGGQLIFVEIFFLSVFALQTIGPQMLFFSVFFKMHFKKVNNRQKRQKWRFLQLIAFFQCIINNTDQKDTCVPIVFKAESKVKNEEKFFRGFFLQKLKTCYFGGSKMVVLITQISNLFFCVCSLM